VYVNGTWWCKPAAGSLAALPLQGRYVYWDALEGTENSKAFVVDADQSLDDDQSRVLVLGPNDTPSWLRPNNNTGGYTDPRASELIPRLSVTSDQVKNNGTMFCSHQSHLPDGTVLVAGGTHYYTEPVTVELEGVEGTRIFDPNTNTWYRTNDMNYGRWYPATVPLANGDILVVGGVHKLERPIYTPPKDPGEPQPIESATNVRESETYSLDTGKWTDNGPGGQRSLPLQPRIHLLPNGNVIYNGAGQAYSPQGQSYDQATWNLVAAYDPKTKTWQEVGYAGFPFTLDKNRLDQISGNLGIPLKPGAEAPNTDVHNPDELIAALGNLLATQPPDETGVTNAAYVGSRFSTFEVPLILKPDDSQGSNGDSGGITPQWANEDPQYNTMELLTAGGTGGLVAATNPGTYIANNMSRIDTVTTSGDQIAYRSRGTGQLNHRRWFSSGILLPTGEVFACSGADKDEVVLPGSELPVTQAEMFDPETETWRNVAEGHRIRTYHNTAVLMQDGRVLVGGHAPIPAGYVTHLRYPGFPTYDQGVGAQKGRDPSFEIYSPPYVDEDRPQIYSSTSGGSPGKGKGKGKKKKPPQQQQARQVNYGENFPIYTPDANDIDDVVLMRVTSVTHVNDTEQRGIKLLFEKDNNYQLTAKMPKEPAVVPPGYWWVFILSKGVPSEGMLIKVPMKR
jgi:hypothetical protein